MENYLTRAVTLIIEVVFNFYIVILSLRFLLQAVGANFYNPLTQVLIKITNPVLVPWRRWVRGFSRIDKVALLVLLVLQMLELVLIFMLKIHQLPHLMGILFVSIAHLISIGVYIFLFAIIIEVIFSWVMLFSGGGHYSRLPAGSILELVAALTDPLIRPIRDKIPPLGGVVDISPLVAILVLQLTLILIAEPLNDMGLRFLIIATKTPTVA